MLTADDRITGYASYLDAKYIVYNNARDYELDPVNGVTLNASGNPTPFSPRESGRVGYEHIFHVEGGTLVPNLSVYAQSAMYLNQFVLPEDRQDGYTKTDFTLRYAPSSEQWSVEGFVHNLEDRHVATMQYNYEAPLLRFYSDPRMYGVRFGFKM